MRRIIAIAFIFQVLVQVKSQFISRDQFDRACKTKSGYGGSKLYKAFISSLEPALISNTIETAKYLAHIVWSSTGLTSMEESYCLNPLNEANCSETYGTASHGTVIYYGRGPLRLSHKYNYKAASQSIFKNPEILLNDPDRVSRKLQIGWDTTAWLWATFVHLKSQTFGSSLKALNNGTEECERKNFADLMWRCDHYRTILGILNISLPNRDSDCLCFVNETATQTQPISKVNISKTCEIITGPKESNINQRTTSKPKVITKLINNLSTITPIMLPEIPNHQNKAQVINIGILNLYKDIVDAFLDQMLLENKITQEITRKIKNSEFYENLKNPEEIKNFRDFIRNNMTINFDNKSRSKPDSNAELYGSVMRILKTSSVEHIRLLWIKKDSIKGEKAETETIATAHVKQAVETLTCEPTYFKAIYVDAEAMEKWILEYKGDKINPTNQELIEQAFFSVRNLLVNLYHNLSLWVIQMKKNGI